MHPSALQRYISAREAHGLTLLQRRPVSLRVVYVTQQLDSDSQVTTDPTKSELDNAYDRGAIHMHMSAATIRPRAFYAVLIRSLNFKRIRHPASSSVSFIHTYAIC